MENENEVIETQEIDEAENKDVAEAESLTAVDEGEAEEQQENVAEDNTECDEADTKKEKKQKNHKLFWKRFAAVAVIVVFAAIIAAVSLCSLLTKSYDFGFNDPTFIRIHTSNSSSSNNNRAFFAGQDEYKKLLDLYKKSMQTKVITALFQGKLGEAVTAKEGYKSLAISGAYLEFNYNTEQKLYLNGQEYNANIISDESYYTIVIEVTNNTNLAEVNAYFKYKTTGSGNYSYVRFASFAAQADLYNYIENM